MSTPATDLTADDATTDPIARRSLLKLGGAAALGALAVAAGPSTVAGAVGQSDGNRRRNTQQVTRSLLRAIASGDLKRMWSFFDRGGVVSQPFTATTITDFATFEATFASFFAVAQGLTFTNIEFVDLDDPDATIAKYNGRATITSTGGAYDQTYITELHVRGNKVMTYIEYFDTYVLYNALGLLDPAPG